MMHIPVLRIPDNFQNKLVAGSVLATAQRRLGFSPDTFSLVDEPPASGVVVAAGDKGAGRLGLLAPNSRGFVLASEGLTVVPTYDPVFIAHGQWALLGVLLHDLALAVKATRMAAIPPLTSITPTPDELPALLAQIPPDALIAYDIETKHIVTEESEDGEGDIVSFQFAIGEDRGYFLPWLGAYIGFVKELMNLPNTKVGHNCWQFDNPILRANGIGIAGTNHDTRWAWHHLQPDLPANLQFVASFFDFPYPWKHMSRSDAVHYGVCDAIATWMIGDQILGDLDTRKVRRGYDRHVLGLEPVLRAMSDRGLPVNVAAREALTADLLTEIARMENDLQGSIPDDIRPFHPKDGYKKGLPVKAEPGEFVLHTFPDEERWVKLDQWKPSIHGLTRYAKFKGHALPRCKGKVTFDKLELSRIVAKTKDPVYEHVLNMRQVSTILTNHVKNWEPGPDGRVHPQFTFAPATGQLSSRNPNIQNAPHHGGEWADRFRGMIQAPVGYTLLELDYKSFHAMTLGYEAGDQDYMRLARMDIHSYLTSYLVKEPIRLDSPDDDLRKQLVSIRARYSRIRDVQAKRAILGYGFGMGYRKLYYMNQDAFTNQAEAKKVIDTLNGLFPRVAQFHSTIRELAHRQGFLLSGHGYVRYFWNVYSWVNGEARPGQDSEAAIAFLPANDAFGHIKDVMLWAAETGWDERAGMVNQIHDSLFFICPDNLVEEASITIKARMELPSQILPGLVVEVAGKAGKTWDQMEAI